MALITVPKYRKLRNNRMQNQRLNVLSEARGTKPTSRILANTRISQQKNSSTNVWLDPGIDSGALSAAVAFNAPSMHCATKAVKTTD